MLVKNDASHNVATANRSLREELGRQLRKSLSAFHNEERGDAVQAILLIFVGVIILVALVNFFFPSVWNNLKTQITQLIQPQS